MNRVRAVSLLLCAIFVVVAVPGGTAFRTSGTSPVLSSLSENATPYAGTQQSKASLEKAESISFSDPLAAIGMLKSLADGTLIDCHASAHKIGSSSYLGGSMGLAELVAIEPSLCLGGIMHGALEEFARSADIQEFETGIGEACSMLRESLVGSCTHGAGHAIAIRIPEDHRAAVQSCGQFKDEMLVTNCAAGVFMAYVDDRREGSPYKPLRGRPSDICTVFNDPYAKECWRKTLKLMEGFSVDEMFKECQLAEDNNDCDRHVGVRMVSEFARPDITDAFLKADAECLKAASVKDCRKGAVWSAANESLARGASRESYVSLCKSPAAVEGCKEEESAVFFE